MNKALLNKVAFVVDGTTDPGKGIVRLFLCQGATVIVPAASADSIQRLKKDLSGMEEGTLVTFLADLPDYVQVNDFTDIILQEFGSIDLAVTTVNTSSDLPLLSDTDTDLWATAENDLSIYFITSKVLLKIMQDPLSMYITVTNPGLFGPGPQTSLRQLIDTTQMEIARLFAVEQQHIKTRYHHLVAGRIAEATTADHPSMIFRKITPETIGRHIIDLFLGNTAEPGKVFQSF